MVRGFIFFGSSTAGGAAYSLTADAGTATLTGATATLTVGRKVSADAGSLSLTGTDAALQRSILFAADAGSLALTGTDALLAVGRALAVDPGAYTLDGTFSAAAVAFDAASESHTGTTPSTSEASFSWTHTPAGTPRGVTVFVFTSESSTPEDTGVTYGGVSMSVSALQAADTVAEPGCVRAYHLGALVPSGAQTVVVSRNNTTASMYAVAVTVTADGNTEIYDAGGSILSNNQAVSEVSVTDGSPGVDSLRLAALYSGLSTLPTIGANSTAVHDLLLAGTKSFSVARETSTGQGSRPVGFSQASDDVAYIAFAVRGVVLPDVYITLGRSILGSAGGYVLDGQDAILDALDVLYPIAASYSFAGADASLAVGRAIAAGVGGYTVTGEAATFALTRAIAAALGEYTLTGQAITVEYDVPGDTYLMASGITSALNKDSTLKTGITGSSSLRVTVTADSLIGKG